ncbi:MAG: uroporphyrinogen-III C-methyltransferase [Stygiolobus sp.]|nr:uroporphyrinogen-III C-methyltransferase [Stygiolobus sp.]
MKGKVYIIGAGPGDPELITIKGKKILQIADVILYDRLIPKQLLDECKGEKIYVGKEIGDAKLQNYINDLLVKKALEGKIVARLKGGDPYVFGRGEEECIYVISHGIECEVIPGVTSAIAAPAYAGIPITSRLASPAVTILTGTRAENKVIEEDYIPKKGTLVILMGIHVIDELQNLLLKVRNPDEQIAIIERGTTPEQRVFIGKLSELSKIVKENNVTSPAVIVIGDVVNLRKLLVSEK